jgi:hypothetical protein
LISRVPVDSLSTTGVVSRFSKILAPGTTESRRALGYEGSVLLARTLLS